MHVQVVTLQVGSGKADQAIAIFRDLVLPAVQQQPGFKNAYFLVDRWRNRAMEFSLWESEADITTLTTSGFYQRQVGRFAAVWGGPPTREVYELEMQA